MLVDIVVGHIYRGVHSLQLHRPVRNVGPDGCRDVGLQRIVTFLRIFHIRIDGG